MNYLAHSLLSCHSDTLLFGNVVADLISNRQFKNLREVFHKGVQLHRFIDTFTDNHLMVKRCTKVLHQHHGKYAPVVFDLLCDRLLTDFWEDFSKISMDRHIEKTYDVLDRNLSYLEIKEREKLDNMIEHDFLRNCTSDIGLWRTMEWMDRRTKFPSNFTQAVDDLYKNYDLFSDAFMVFFKELRKEVKRFCNC